MAVLADGNQIAREILQDLKVEVDLIKKNGLAVRLIAIMVGNNPASSSYVKIKQRQADTVGIQADIRRYPTGVNEAQLLSDISVFGEVQDVCGIMVQLPLPSTLRVQKILDAVPADLDVDCLAETNKQRLFKGERVSFEPPAAAAVLKILEYYHVDLSQKNILLVGSGDLVGKPLAAMLLKRKISFEIANSFTKNLRELTRRAEVIITGVGKPGLITGDMINEGTVVVDAGTTGSQEGEISGDVDVRSVAVKASLLTPVPGGVGPVTVVMLLKNVVNSAMSKYHLTQF